MGNKLKITVTDSKKLLEITRRFPLATIITTLDENIEISHLPIVSTLMPNGKIKFHGHLSTRNPQWQHLKNGASVTLVFNGPNTYINSSWYLVNDVSTWNYVTVQASGSPVLEESYNQIINILKATTDLSNQLYTDQWDFYIPEDLKSEQELTAAIGGFSLETSTVSGRFKLSQSKSLDDQRNIIHELSQRQDENSKLVAMLMTENIENL